MKPKCPCKDCEERHPKCHVLCEQYKDFKAENEAIAKKREKERLSTPTMSKRTERDMWRNQKWR